MLEHEITLPKEEICQSLAVINDCLNQAVEQSGKERRDTLDSLQALKDQFGKQVRCLRKKQRLRQTGLARLCGLHVSHISKIERGQANITIGTAVVLARSLQVSLSDLFRLAEAPPLAAPSSSSSEQAAASSQADANVGTTNDTTCAA